MVWAVLLFLLFFVSGLPLMAVSLVITIGHILDDKAQEEEWKEARRKSEQSRFGM